MNTEKLLRRSNISIPPREKLLHATKTWVKSWNQALGPPCSVLHWNRIQFRWLTWPVLNQFSLLPLNQFTSVPSPCAFCASIPTDCMPAQSRSDFFPQLEQSPQDETDGFLPETDRERGLCNRQPGLGDAYSGNDSLYQCPTSSCYVTVHWQSARNKVRPLLLVHAAL